MLNDIIIVILHNIYVQRNDNIKSKILLLRFQHQFEVIRYNLYQRKQKINIEILKNEGKHYMDLPMDEDCKC